MPNNLHWRRSYSHWLLNELWLLADNIIAVNNDVFLLQAEDGRLLVGTSEGHLLGQFDWQFL